MKRIFLLMIWIPFFAGTSYTQELGVHFMDDFFQSNMTNPAKMSKHRLVIGFPSPYFNVGMNGPTLEDMAVRNGKGEQMTIDIDRGLAKIKDLTFIKSDIKVETFNIGYRMNKLQFGISHAVRFHSTFDFPRELAEMAFNGNSQYIDQTVEVGPGLDVSLFGELALHGAYQLTEKLSIGGRLKFLSGVANFSTGKNSMSIYTDPDYYQLTATTDYQVNAAGEFVSLNIVTDADSSDFDLQTNGDQFSAGKLFFGGSPGFAIDLGAEYQVNDKIKIGFSALDLGAISWNKNPTNYTSNGEFTFEGINADEVFFGEDSLAFDDVLDTLVGKLGFEESKEKYSTGITPKFYLSGTYDVSKMITVGGVIYGEVLRGRFRPALGVSSQFHIGKVLDVGAMYSIRNNSFANLGVNLGLTLGPVQFFTVTDNLISVFKPFDTKNVNFRAGFNIALSKKKNKIIEEDQLLDE